MPAAGAAHRLETLQAYAAPVMSDAGHLMLAGRPLTVSRPACPPCILSAWSAFLFLCHWSGPSTPKILAAGAQTHLGGADLQQLAGPVQDMEAEELDAELLEPSAPVPAPVRPQPAYAQPAAAPPMQAVGLSLGMAQSASLSTRAECTCVVLPVCLQSSVCRTCCEDPGHHVSCFTLLPEFWTFPIRSHWAECGHAASGACSAFTCQGKDRRREGAGGVGERNGHVIGPAGQTLRVRLSISPQSLGQWGVVQWHRCCAVCRAVY